MELRQSGVAGTLLLALTFTACVTPTKTIVRPAGPLTCASSTPMAVHFIDVGQALAVPDGQTVLVDAGESPARAGRGAPCREAHEHLLDRLDRILAGRPLSMLWVTHQHSDHLGGAPAVLSRFKVLHVVDNGTERAVKQVMALQQAAAGANVTVVGPGREVVPLQVEEPLKLIAVVPDGWPGNCARDKNDCYIGLRIDYCASSVLFTGDAEETEESVLPLEPATLVQVGHHGSDTSSSSTYLAKTQPKYAVISSGKPDEGTNRTYCHPRASAVEAVSAALGPASGSTTITAFEGKSCRDSTPANWLSVPVNERLFSTARDGDVTLVTTGDGVLTRVP